jgi:hypothetical protein
MTIGIMKKDRENNNRSKDSFNNNNNPKENKSKYSIHHIMKYQLCPEAVYLMMSLLSSSINKNIMSHSIRLLLEKGSPYI